MLLLAPVSTEAIIDSGADYILSVKDNQENLKKDIEDYVQDKVLQADMETVSQSEKSRERTEDGQHMLRMKSAGCQAGKRGQG